MIEDSRRRSRRLRKKLRVGEFQIMGFSLAVTLRDSLTIEQDSDFWDRFILEAIEDQRLTYGGLTEGYVAPEGDVSATEADREHVKQWLLSQPEVIDFKVGQLSDAYGQRGPLYPILATRKYSPALTMRHWTKFHRTEF